jgi:hypothetical protein
MCPKQLPSTTSRLSPSHVCLRHLIYAAFHPNLAVSEQPSCCRRMLSSVLHTFCSAPSTEATLGQGRRAAQTPTQPAEVRPERSALQNPRPLTQILPRFAGDDEGFHCARAGGTAPREVYCLHGAFIGGGELLVASSVLRSDFFFLSCGVGNASRQFATVCDNLTNISVPSFAESAVDCEFDES